MVKGGIWNFNSLPWRSIISHPPKVCQASCGVERLECLINNYFDDIQCNVKWINYGGVLV